jgi:hypothetical protein
MALTPDEQTKLDTLLKSDDGRILQSWKDSQVSNAIRATLEKNPGLPDVAKRIETIKSEYEKKTKQLEINNLVMKKCFEKGVNYEAVAALGMSFADSAEIDNKLNLLQKDIELKKEKDFNDFVLKNNVKPGMGQQFENTSICGMDTKTWNSLSKDVKAEVASEYTKKQRAKK